MICWRLDRFSQTAEPSRTATLRAVQMARSLGKTIAYDPNWRPSLWKDKTAGIETMRAFLPYADILKVSDEEAVLLTGVSDWKTAACRLAAYGPRAVFITLGPDGCYYRLAGKEGMAEGYRVRPVDTTGAGDAFFGAALFMIHQYGGLDALTPQAAGYIARFAKCCRRIMCNTARRHSGHAWTKGN